MAGEQPIQLVSYDDSWPEKFSAEKDLLQETLDGWIVGGIEHVGSTSIPGLTAKPVVDIMVGVEDLEKAKECIDILEKIGYCYAPYKDFMHWFCKPSPMHREFHLILIEPKHPQWKARIAFRDYLRSHPDIANEYLELKKKLAVDYKNDREAYTEAKGDFVKRIVNIALSQ